MKKEGHPKYQKTLFIDSSTGTKFVCGSSIQSDETEMLDGVEYPVYRVPVSSASHPLFTGTNQFVDSEGRVDKFMKRYGKKGSKKEESKEESSDS